MQISLIARGGIQAGISNGFVVMPEAELAGEIIFDTGAHYLGFGVSIGYCGLNYKNTDFFTGEETNYSSSAPTACIYLKYSW